MKKVKYKIMSFSESGLNCGKLLDKVFLRGSSLRKRLSRSTTGENPTFFKTTFEPFRIAIIERILWECNQSL